jgi:aminopeptidase YwaD
VLKSIIEPIQAELSGERALDLVAAITRYHRIQASPGFRAAAEFAVRELERAGLEVELLSFPANHGARFWSLPMFQEWEAEGARLWLVEPEERKLADYAESKLALIQRSGPAELEAELVLLEDGEELEEYEGLDLRKKAVLTKGDLQRVYDLAVERAGAEGIIFDGMREFPIRQRLDLLDARQYTSFWWSGKERKCFGFVLTPREGERLRRLFKEGKRLKIKAEVKSRFWDGQAEVVSALIPGEGKEEVLIVAHLCHPQPSANDNASGAAALLEAARALQALIAQGRLSRPKRGLRFLLVPEMTGTIAYLATHEDAIPKMVAGLNLDMVGEDQDRCGSSLLIDRLPGATPGFIEPLVRRVREEFTHELKGFANLGGYASFRYAEVPFSGGSDHYVLSDPTVGVPTVMLIQWPDRFYHTSLDTVDKVSPKMLALAANLAACSAYFVANAGEREALWLAQEVVVQAKAALLKLIQERLGAALTADDEREVRRLALRLAREGEYLADREAKALDSILRLAPLDLSDERGELSEFAGHELARARELIARETRVKLTKGAKREPEPEPWAERAGRLVPMRRYRGPLAQIQPYLRKLPWEDREAWHRLRKDFKDKPGILPILALYWADGKRTLAEIIELVELESGEQAGEWLVRHFELLEKMGLIVLNRRQPAH